MQLTWKARRWSVRAKDAEEVVSALSRGEVACVLVSDKALLELDLAELTYG